MKGQITSEKGLLSLASHKRRRSVQKKKRKGFVASAIFILYTRKIDPIFSDIHNRIFDFEVAALHMMYFEWFYIFPRSRINLSFVVSFIFLGDTGETKLIREATLQNHISGSLQGIPIYGLGLKPPWSQLDLGSVKRTWYAHPPVVSEDHGQEGRRCFTTLGP